MLILLPPSEGKAAPHEGPTLNLDGLCLPSLTAARTAVIEALVDLCQGDHNQAMATLAIPKTQPELVGLNATLAKNPSAVASSIYTGVVYDALGFDSLSPEGQSRAQDQIMVSSSLFGLVGLGDLIPSYRLSGGSTLPGLGGIQAHWRKHLEPAAVEALGEGLLIDLRSGTYAAFWKPAVVASQTATVRVLHERDGVRKVVSHFNKATKGRIVRALIEGGIAPATPAELAEALGDLGWTVEVTKPGKLGTGLDVIVTEL